MCSHGQAGGLPENWTSHQYFSFGCTPYSHSRRKSGGMINDGWVHSFADANTETDRGIQGFLAGLPTNGLASSRA
jgi:hypothetical protein